MDSAHRREAILKAATAVMVEKGVADTAISDITVAAGIAKGTFYLHFDSKSHMLGAIWDRYVDQLIEQAAAALQEARQPGTRDWLSVAYGLIERLIRYDVEHAELRRMMYEGAGADALRMFAEGSTRLLEVLRQTLRQGVAEGGFATDYPDMAADLIYHAAYGVLKDRILYGPPLDVERFIDALKDMVRKCLGPPNG